MRKLNFDANKLQIRLYLKTNPIIPVSVPQRGYAYFNM